MGAIPAEAQNLSPQRTQRPTEEGFGLGFFLTLITSFCDPKTQMKRTSDNSPVAQRLRRIEGRHNALVKELRQVFAKAERDQEGDCAIEGVRIVEEAIRSGLKFRAVFFKESAQNLAERLLPQIGANVDTLLLPDRLFDSCVPSESPAGRSSTGADQGIFA